MYVISYLTKKNITNKLRQVTLLGSDIRPYAKARITFSASVNPSALWPCQNYVLQSNLQYVGQMVKELQLSPISMFSKRNYLGGVTFSDNSNVFSLLPPIVEHWNGKMIVADGMHRVSYAIQNKLMIDFIYIRDIDKRCPYYALPLDNGWKDVKIMENKPEVGKVYREQSDYKRLFRDYNAQFPNIQQKRSTVNETT
jgi:hypothetical protein